MSDCIYKKGDILVATKNDPYGTGYKRGERIRLIEKSHGYFTCKRYMGYPQSLGELHRQGFIFYRKPIFIIKEK